MTFVMALLPPLLLSLLAMPSLALVLLLAGVLLLYLEFNVPGKVLPACTGMLLAMLALYGLLQWPLRPAALGAAVVGIVLILLEIRFKAGSLLALSGACVLARSLARLTVPSAPQVEPTIAALVTIVFTTVTLLLGRVALQARRNKALGHRRLRTAG